MDLNLRDKVALVTGGSRGLGRAICVALAAEGAKVAVNYYRNREKKVDLRDEAEEVAATIRKDYGISALPVPGDVGHGPDVPAMFDLIEESLGPVDVLVNNAGVWPTAYVAEMDEAEWNATMQVNLTGPFLTCREAVRRWLAAGRTGRIVNVSSQAAFHGSTTGHAHYAASKAGLVNFTVSLAREVARHGIHVNGIAPGYMRTDMARDALEKNEQKCIERIPLGRIADPSEMAAVITFLCSDKASYMTGATVDVTGGMLMR